MIKSAQSGKPIFKPLAFKARTGCSEYVLPKGRKLC